MDAATLIDRIRAAQARNMAELIVKSIAAGYIDPEKLTFTSSGI